MNFRALSLAAALVLALASLGVAWASYPSDLPPSAITPQPTSTPATPATPAPRRGRKATPAPEASPANSGSPTPAPPQYTTLDGTWEIEFQQRDTTKYAHWILQQSGQSGSDVTGVWDQGGKPAKKVPITGTFDGRLFKFTAKDGTKEFTFSGYVENFSDIVGMANDGKTDTAFTAQHRKKEHPLDYINPVGIPGVTR
ncbi:MAG: hypothetical protein ACRENA_05050 [Vulcanimicrobiaceae bacterium]